MIEGRNDGMPSEGELVISTASGDGLTRQAFLRRGAGGLVAFSSLAALLAACGGKAADGTGTGTGAGAEGSPPSKPTGTLNVAMQGFPVSLDPTVDGAVSTIAVLNQVFEGLVAFDPEYKKLVPSLATKWESSPDARTWTFTLREGVKFHDGSVLDATAVRKSIEYTLRKNSGFGVLLGEPTVDDSTPGQVVFKYKDPYPDCARNLTSVGPIFSPKITAGSIAATEKRAAKQFAGSGPYRIASVRDGQSVELRAFEGHWNNQGHIATIKYQNISEESARNAALAAGDVDVVIQMAPLAARSLKSNNRVTPQSRPTWTTVTLHPNCSAKPFDDLRVRQAMMHALDRKTIIDKLLLGEAQLGDSMLPQGVYGYAPTPTQYEFDLEKAKALLKESSYDGSQIRMSTRSDAVLASEISQAMVAQLSAAGFKITSEVLDPAAFEADKYLPKPKYQLHWNEGGWVNGGPFHLTFGIMAKISKYSTKEYDALVAKVSTTPDGPEREKLIAETVEVWAKDAAWVNLWVPNRIDTTVATLQDYRTPPNVRTLFRDAYLAS